MDEPFSKAVKSAERNHRAAGRAKRRKYAIERDAANWANNARWLVRIAHAAPTILCERHKKSISPPNGHWATGMIPFNEFALFSHTMQRSGCIFYVIITVAASLIASEWNERAKGERNDRIRTLACAAWTINILTNSTDGDNVIKLLERWKLPMERNDWTRIPSDTLSTLLWAQNEFAVVSTHFSLTNAIAQKLSWNSWFYVLRLEHICIVTSNKTNAFKVLRNF